MKGDNDADVRVEQMDYLADDVAGAITQVLDFNVGPLAPGILAKRFAEYAKANAQAGWSEEESRRIFVEAFTRTNAPEGMRDLVIKGAFNPQIQSF